MQFRGLKMLFATAAGAVLLAASPLVAAAAGADKAGYETPPRLAQWGPWGALQIGVMNPLPEDQGWEKKFYGSLRHTGTWFGPMLYTRSGRFQWTSYGFEDMDDPKGWERYSSLGVDVKNAPKGLTAYNFMPTVRASPKGAIPDPGYKSWGMQPAKFTITAEGKGQYTLPNGSDVITFDEKTIVMDTNDHQVKLTGKLVTPGTQQLRLWREPDGRTEGMIYTTQWYSVEGTYYGEPVTGLLPVEQIWGDKSYVNTWWVHNRQFYEILFATTYDDGTTETGVFECDRLSGRGAVIVGSDGKSVVTTNEFNMETTRTPDGRVAHVVYKFNNGPDWEFISAPERDGMFYEFGTVKRVGEKRKIVRADALQAAGRKGEICAPQVYGQAAR